MFAVVKIGSSQHLVNPGQELLVDYQSGAKDKIVFDEVLLVADADKIMVGQPTVAGAKVEAEVLGHPKGKKLRIAKFKAKSRYRKVTGFRPIYTKIKISGISLKKSAVRETKD